jgi:predicted RND superfamily exporter protein
MNKYECIFLSLVAVCVAVVVCFGVAFSYGFSIKF